MKKYLALILIILSAFFISCKNETSLDYIVELSEEEKNSPVVFMLHGYGSNAENFKELTHFEKEALPRGYSVVYVSSSAAGWGSGAGLDKSDDVKALCQLAKKLQKEFHFDKKRTYVAGFSNGGFMSHRIAVQGKGTFYRNYNQDVLALYEKEEKIVLSRDGFLRLLPEGLLTRDDDLRGEDFKAKYEELEWRRELLNETFTPYDTYVFRKKLEIERHASELLDQKLSYLLKEYFNYDIEAERNKLVKEAAVMLPFVSSLRGDLGLVGNLLGALMQCEVEVVRGRYSPIDTTRLWLPQVTYKLLIPDLTPASYQELAKSLEPLAAFLKEWLIPFDVRCVIEIKQHWTPQHPDGSLTLNYNTELNQ